MQLGLILMRQFLLVIYIMSYKYVNAIVNCRAYVNGMRQNWEHPQLLLW